MDFFIYTFLIAFFIFLPISTLQLIKSSYLVILQMMKEDIKFVLKTISASLILGLISYYTEGIITIDVILYGILGFITITLYELYSYKK